MNMFAACATHANWEIDTIGPICSQSYDGIGMQLKFISSHIVLHNSQIILLRIEIPIL
jgi:hypothetical protein